MTSKDICLLFIILFLCLFPLLSSCTVISESSKKAKTKATKKKGQKTFCFWCCVEEGRINFVLPLCWKKTTKNKSIFVDSLLFLSTLRGWIFPWALSRKLITWAKSVTLTNLAKTPSKNTIRQVKSMRKFLHALKRFPNFSFVCFHWKITWHLCKVNK